MMLALHAKFCVFTFWKESQFVVNADCDVSLDELDYVIEVVSCFVVPESRKSNRLCVLNLFIL